MHALGLEFGSAGQLPKRPGSVLNCLWGNALKRSPGIIRKSRVSYPGLGFLSSATWPSLPKKHYNGLNQTKPYSLGPPLSALAPVLSVCPAGFPVQTDPASFSRLSAAVVYFHNLSFWPSF